VKKNLGIRGKLQLLFGPAMALILAVLVVFVNVRATSLVRELLKTAGAETSARYATVIGSRMDNLFATARTLGQVVEGSGREPPARRRASVSGLLEGMLDKNQTLSSIWTTWEPDALDGLDGQNVGSAYGNDVGRFDATIYRGPDGSLRRKVSPEAEILESEYYLEPKKTNQDTVVGPYLYSYEEGAEPLLETSVIVPIRAPDTTFRGVLGIDIPQSTFQTIVAPIKPYGTGFAVLYAKGGAIAAHPDPSLVAKSLDDEAPLFPPADFELYKAAVLGIDDASLFLSRDGARYLASIRKFRLGSSYTRWTLAVLVPEAKVLDGSRALTTLMAAAGVAALFLVFLLVFAASRLVARPVGRVSAGLRDIAMGEGNLSLRLPATARDETGELAGYFNDFVCKLEATVTKLKEVGRSGASIGDELAASSEESSATVTELDATVRSLQGKIASLDASIRSVEEAVGGISKGIDAMGGLVVRQSEAVVESKGASESIVEALGAMAKAAGERGAVADGLAERARAGEAVVGGVLGAVKDIGGYTARIAEMAQVINDVAERTNLLAMNAAIEAAHAGDRGRGFAVVADEIRKLAEATGKNAATISQQLKTVTAKIDETSAGAEEAGASIRAMSEGMGQAAASFREVLAGLTALAGRGAEAGRALDALVASTDELEAASADIDRRSDAIREETLTLSRLSSENTAGFSEMAAGIREMRTASEELSRLGIENSRIATVMEEELGRFKTSEDLCAGRPEGQE